MKSITLLFVVLIATTYAQQNDGDWTTCLNAAADLIQDGSTYIKKKNWFDGTQIAKILKDITNTFSTCKALVPSKALQSIEQVSQLAVSATCKARITAMLNILSQMKSLLWQRRFTDFVSAFGKFKVAVINAKNGCP